MTWKKIKNLLIVKSAKILIYLISAFNRKKTLYLDKHSEKDPERNTIYLFWHRYILYNVFFFRNKNAVPLISMSKDGSLISDIAEEFKMSPVRGSSSKGGAAALINLINTLKQHKDKNILITGDGPKGPACELKKGIVMLAEKTGCPVVPVMWKASRCITLKKSWDKFKIPLPFGRIEFYFGKKFDMKNMPGSMEEQRLELEQYLISMEREAEKP